MEKGHYAAGIIPNQRYRAENRKMKHMALDKVLRERNEYFTDAGESGGEGQAS